MYRDAKADMDYNGYKINIEEKGPKNFRVRIFGKTFNECLIHSVPEWRVKEVPCRTDYQDMASYWKPCGNKK